MLDQLVDHLPSTHKVVGWIPRSIYVRVRVWVRVYVQTYV
jgi:hypothetical protein